MITQKKFELHHVSVSDGEWYEIDTHEDLELVIRVGFEK